jgi:hypothetical protein
LTHFVARLFSDNRAGFISSPHGWARFRRGKLVDASPAVANAYSLMSAHFEQVGF